MANSNDAKGLPGLRKGRKRGLRGGVQLGFRALALGLPAYLMPSVLTLSLGPCIENPALAPWSTAASAAALVEGGSNAILTLASDDEAAAVALTDALRRRVQELGVGNDSQMSLGEIRLTMGCAEADFGCLASGGRAIQADRLIYGSLNHIENGFSVHVEVLDTAEARLLLRQEFTFAYEALSPDNIDGVAARMIDIVFQPEKGASAPIDLGSGGAVGAAAGDGKANGESDSKTEAADSGKKRGRRGSRRRPKIRTPGTVSGSRRGRGPGGKERGLGSRDKNYNHRGLATGFGVSLGLAAGAAATAIILETRLVDDGKLRTELLDTALASLTDDNPTNDVDPYTDSNLCTEAQRSGSNRGVRNPDMADICQRAERVALGRTLSWVASGTLAVTSAVLLGVLIKQKRKQPAAAALLKRQPSFAIAPRRGGLELGLGFKF